MATPRNSTSTLPPLRPSLTEQETVIQTDLALPGIKRGIAIGVACSVFVLLIAILAFFAIRRRNRVLARRAQCNAPAAGNLDVETGSQEKAWWSAPPPSPPPPPVEADTQTIYELDANPIPELPGVTSVQEVDGKGIDRDAADEANEIYDQKLKQWKTWSIALESNDSSEVRHCHLPLLTVSPPETTLGDVSPMLYSSWDLSLQDASPISPPPNALFPSRRYP
ncbi:60s ribosomal l44 [Pyrenophora seminiperda CCB06]|uniref:60s ribosomal l44 n=1 Tax=Pyrenophora seminiperda CCB06 TaxID=1302712 RepID=A0A3M7M504_9PLEO|nr:60s ribosomal l44 [Pyrenophora seminiperda CCB06]